jgi:hypothetical protein
MPRLASRITLEIKDVRVERVQDISEAEAMSEGIMMSTVPSSPPLHSLVKYIAPGVTMTNQSGEKDDYAPAHNSARKAYECLWDSINAKRGYGWDENPWVWVIEFERVEVPNE